ncbi:dihydroorotate dehydrogenase-like protein [Endozoicomonas ascidiicola]|uniref:dihydroorotate dehydrogenase-like protein n=1 Tax=Endozoicomonas ascidiicola TaxID=1698521 RepID=UPI000834A70D|nr:dihydroorotate dehydrogenase-like protein [Endozoicomonas ascidiicola]
MLDLSTRYLGLTFKNPLIASASPLTSTVKSVQRLERAGIGAVVLPSLFEEQCLNDAAPQQYLDMLQKTKASVEIPVIASMNGYTEGDWLASAVQLEKAGADAIELNIYYNPPSFDVSSQQVEQVYLDILHRVKSEVTVPVSLKVDPFFSAFGNMARQFDEIGVDGLVIFNRMIQPDFNLNTMQLETSWPISKAGDIGAPLKWVSSLHGRVNVSLAASSGAFDHEDIIKYLLAGADTVMLASALIRNGADYVSVLLKGINVWMKQRDFASLNDMRGLMSQKEIQNPEAFERANYIRAVDGVV